MQLSLHADYSLRVLIYLASAEPAGRVVSTQEISVAYGISRHHLVRVVQTLADNGYVKATAGRTGGICLAMAPKAIRIGEVVRGAERTLKLVECFDRKTNTCPIAPVCALKGMLREGLEAFLTTLNQYTLADIATVRDRGELVRILQSA